MSFFKRTFWHFALLVDVVQGVLYLFEGETKWQHQHFLHKEESSISSKVLRVPISTAHFMCNLDFRVRFIAKYSPQSFSAFACAYEISNFGGSSQSKFARGKALVKTGLISLK